MKKLGALVLAALMLMSSLSMVAFAESDALEELSLFGIVPQTINRANLEEDATREELAYLASRILNQSAVEPIDTRFTDVTKDSIFSGYIEFMAGRGIINGKGNGIFDPSGAVKPEMASKVFVSLLGYDSFGQFEGGYPDGYTNIASLLGMTKYISVNANGNLTKGALVDVCRYVLVTGFNRPQYVTVGGETKVLLSDEKSSLLASALKVSVYTGQVTAINPKMNTVSIDIAKNKYETNYEVLSAGNYTFDLAKGLDCFEYEYLPVTLWVDAEGVILKMSPSNKTEVKYGYIDSVNGKLSNDSNPVPNIDELTFLDDEEEYDVSSSAMMKFNGEITTKTVSLIGKFAKVIIENGEITFIESWDLTEGGLLSSIKDESLTFTKGTQKNATIKKFDEFKIKRVFINNKPSDMSFLKEKTVFDYFVKDDMIVIVDSEKTIMDTLYTKSAGGLEIGNAIYKTDKPVYYSRNGVDFKESDFAAFLSMDIIAYIGSDGNVRYVLPDEGKAITRTKVFATLKSYDTDVFGEELSLQFLVYSAGGIETKSYKYTKKTDGLSKDVVLSKASIVDYTNLFVIEVNEDGVIKKIDFPPLYSGFAGKPQGWVGHIWQSSHAMLYYDPDFVNDPNDDEDNPKETKRLYFNKTNTPIMAIYEKDGVFAAETFTWDDNLNGKADLEDPFIYMTAFGDETKNSSPSMIFFTGDVKALKSDSARRLGIVVDKTTGLNEVGDECVVLHVLSGSAKPEEYRVSKEVAQEVPKYSLVSYSFFKYEEGEQGSDDDIDLKRLTSNGEKVKAIALDADVSVWPVEASLTDLGLHKGTIDAIDNVRLLTTDDTSAYIDPAASSTIISVQYNPDNATKRFETIELSDINYGDEVYYYTGTYGLLKCVIKIG